MIIKNADARDGTLRSLRLLLEVADSRKSQKDLREQIQCVENSIKAQNEAGMVLDSDFGGQDRMAVIHDLQLECPAGKARIDHLLISNTLSFTLLSTRYFYNDLRISESGKFTRFNVSRKAFEDLDSPLDDSRQSIDVLQAVLEQSPLWAAMPDNLRPGFAAYTLVSPYALIKRPRSFDCSSVVSINQFTEALALTERANSNSLFSATPEPLDSNTLGKLATWLSRQHRPCESLPRTHFTDVVELVEEHEYDGELPPLLEERRSA